MDVEERLNWLDEAYLKDYEVLELDSEVRTQQPIGTKEIIGYYPLGEDETEEDASHLAWAFMYSNYDDVIENEAMDILLNVLFNLPGAPVKEALIKAGVGKDVSAYVGTYIKQPMVMVMVRNTDSSKLGEMKKIIMETLKKIADEGINRNSLLAAVNGAEFHYCEADFGRFPKGLEYGVTALSTWLYNDRDAFTKLHLREIYPKLREKIETGYFEDIIRNSMLNSNSQVFSSIAPKKGMGAEEEKKLADRLAAMKAAMSEEEIDKLVADTAALKAYQSEPSTPEDLKTLPLLDRKDIKREFTPYIYEKTDIGGTDTLFHDIETNDIVYLGLLFNASGLSREMLPYAGLAMNLMGSMDSENYSYLELNNQVNIHTGGISTDMASSPVNNETDAYKPYMAVSGRAMIHSIDKLCALIREELLRTDYSSMTRVREILGEIISRSRYSMAASGNATASRRAASYFSSVDKYNDIISGYSFYKFICGLAEMDDEKLKAEVAKAEEAVRMLVTRGNLMIDVICTKDILDRSADSIAALVESFPAGTKPETDRGITFEKEMLNEGFKTSGEVNYLAVSGRFTVSDARTKAALVMLRVILSREYLYNKLRVLGGAYGCGFSSDDVRGVGGFYSYRDPHLKRTLEVYREAADYVENFDADDREMTKYVIGTIGDLDQPLSPSAKGARSLSAYLCGISLEERQEMRDFILAAKPEDIRSAAKVIRQIVDTGAVCAVGSESKINSHPEMFGEIKTLV